LVFYLNSIDKCIKIWTQQATGILELQLSVQLHIARKYGLTSKFQIIKIEVEIDTRPVTLPVLDFVNFPN